MRIRTMQGPPAAGNAERAGTMREVAELLRDARRVAIFSHVDPDGDAAGSALGLAHLLRDAGRDARVFLPGGAPGLYRFLPGADGIGADAAAVPDDRDLLAVLDATSPSRLAQISVPDDASSTMPRLASGAGSSTVCMPVPSVRTRRMRLVPPPASTT